MSVDIDIDINAGDAVAQIASIEGALESLERASGDIDIDLEGDISGITDELTEFSQALDDIDVDIQQLTGDLDDVADKLNDLEMTHKVEMPDGEVGDGDSTGNDPPSSSGKSKKERFRVSDFTFDFSDISDAVSGKGAEGGSTETDASLLDALQRRYGEQNMVHVSDSDIGELLKTSTFRPTNNLGKHSPDVPDYDALERIGFSGPFGMEPESMREKRESLLRSGEMEDVLDYDVGGLDEFFDSSSFDANGLDNAFIDSDTDVSRTLRPLQKVRDATDKLGNRMNKLRPTMSKYMQLLAAFIPVAVALGANLLGVAAAFGAVAAAGAGVIGLGLLGHGQNLADSMAYAEERVKGLKRELFEVFQPTAQQFAPIQERIFDQAPQMLRGVAQEMKGLTKYEDTLFNIGGSLIDGLEGATEIIVQNEAAISQLAERFTRLTVDGVLDVFQNFIRMASKNQDLIVQLGSGLVTLAVAAYNVSMAIAKLLTALQPVFGVLLFISELINSEMVVGLVTLITYLFAFGKAAGIVYMVAQAFMTVSGAISQAAMMMLGYEMSTWSAVAATLALAGAIGLLTFGLSTVIGGAVTAGAMGSQNIPTGPSSGSGPGGSGKQVVYNDNRSFTIENGSNTDYAQQKSMEDTVRSVGEKNDAMRLPKTGQ